MTVETSYTISGEYLEITVRTYGDVDSYGNSWDTSESTITIDRSEILAWLFPQEDE